MLSPRSYKKQKWQKRERNPSPLLFSNVLIVLYCQVDYSERRKPQKKTESRPYNRVKYSNARPACPVSSFKSERGQRIRWGILWNVQLQQLRPRTNASGRASSYEWREENEVKQSRRGKIPAAKEEKKANKNSEPRTKGSKPDEPPENANRRHMLTDESKEGLICPHLKFAQRGTTYIDS